MNTTLETTGGTRIGWVNATWPFAKLSATVDKLSVSGSLIGRFDYPFTGHYRYLKEKQTDIKK